jgi:hypothetical protein
MEVVKNGNGGLFKLKLWEIEIVENLKCGNFKLWKIEIVEN